PPTSELRRRPEGGGPWGNRGSPTPLGHPPPGCEEKCQIDAEAGAQAEPRLEGPPHPRQQPAEHDEERERREQVAVEARQRPKRARREDRREHDEERVE